MLKPSERYLWIARYLVERSASFPQTCDVTHAYFVRAYIENCKPPRIGWMPYGAHKVPQLGRDLSEMHKRGLLSRYVAGLGDMRSMGFPSWVYVYRLTPEGFAIC
jgi:hypothetical protein